ncbi:transcriptional regulatory protein RtcR [Nannocystis exedens]|uniref:Transcriptional regulatory protein RtcR n=1 Tax=Nannocystis exedens TaxID=54 RepID=A0A1I2ADX6_9BACT|nr:RNA repair transcriptional activator RtcR [Nannocystis exedens]PCC69769.1 transcriptional regulator [Nannocystis exedens]SFE41758.1 transcriptional regulatory protein RtcR [Nannocystis exedens]
MRRPTVVLGILGSQMDIGGRNRWDRWRPTVDLCRHDDLIVDRLELIHGNAHTELAEAVTADIAQVSPETRVRLHTLDFADPWAFEEVYAGLLDFVRAYPFRPDDEDYLVHITTGTHVQQICLFLLTESRYLPGRLLQTIPPARRDQGDPGGHAIIDLDLARYAPIAARFAEDARAGESFLKAGIATRNAAFNELITQIEQVAGVTRAPILLTGPTGAGKTRLARKIFELKQNRHQIRGTFVELNCATLRGDAAMSALFGHVRGAFTGAVRDRAGVLKLADGGLLFLDEIGELGLDEQAMLLRAIEDRVFLPVGSDREVRSEFQLVAGTNRDLRADVVAGRFREDLLARIDLWSFRLPGLRERREDIEPNLDYELERWSQRHGRKASFYGQARAAFVKFATAADAVWSGNFRDLAAAIERMATLAPGGRIGVREVEAEIARLRAAWSSTPVNTGDDLLTRLLGRERLAEVDPFDRVQLAEVVRVCAAARSLSDAGRTLFAASRLRKRSSNDADRLRKYLQRFDLEWADIHPEDA